MEPSPPQNAKQPDSLSRPSDDIDSPIFWGPSLAFLKYVVAFILAGSLAFLTVLWIIAPEQVFAARGVTPALLLVVGVAGGLLFRRGKINAAALTMALGIWGCVTGASFFFGGLHSIVIVVYPLIIIMGGWMFGTRFAASLALLTAATVLGFFQAELWNVLPLQPSTPPALIWLVQTFVLVASSVLVTQLVNSYKMRLVEVRKLGSELTQRNLDVQAREADLSRAQALSHVGSWVYELASDSLRLSAETCRIYGLPEGATGGYDAYLAQVHPDDRTRIDTAWHTMLKGREPFDAEHRILVGRQIRWVRQMAEFEFAGDGTPLRSVGTTQDITERKQILDDLRNSVAFQELLSEAIPLPVFHKDNAGRYTGCNSAFAHFTGRTKDEIVGKTVADVAPHDIARTYTDRDLDLLSGPTGTQTYESVVAHADGTIHDVIFHKARITDSAGKPTGIVGAITDITELKEFHAREAQLQGQLRESQKMEALGTLAGGVAHDFNNIVAAIIGNMELAREDVGPGHLALESLDEIGKASRRAQDLVQQILAFSRRQATERKVMSLVPAVQEAVKLLNVTLPAGLTLSVKCAKDTPPVLADATQFQQVLLNLCSNAVHAIRDQKRAGKIDIRLDAEVRDGLRFASLTVRDNGRGMDKATCDRIFEPFFTTKPVGEGTGLGMSVVHGILKEHKASIEVKSTLGEGTTFIVRFPAEQASAQAAPAASRQVAVVRGRGQHVLYVDDDESLVFLVQRMLERRGFRVSGYTGQGEALDALRAEPDSFDLVVTDYKMPGASGVQVAHAVRAIRADLPVAIASGFIDEKLHADASEAGVRELIFKANHVEDYCEAFVRLAQTVDKDSKIF